MISEIPNTTDTTYEEDLITLLNVEDTIYGEDSITLLDIEHLSTDLCTRKIDPPETRKGAPTVRNTIKSSTPDLCIRKLVPPGTKQDDPAVRSNENSKMDNLDELAATLSPFWST
jgi:hypothetical protein